METYLSLQFDVLRGFRSVIILMSLRAHHPNTGGLIRTISSVRWPMSEGIGTFIFVEITLYLIK